MTEKTQAELDAEQAKANAEAQDDDTAEDKEKSKSDEESKQLEAELKKEREAREKAEKATADYAFKLREKKRKQEDVEEEDEEEEDKPLTFKQFQAMQAQQEDKLRKEMQKTEITRLADSFSNNETEKSLILEIHRNRSFPSHLSIEEQLEECYVIANKKKILGENKELKRALNGKRGVNSDASGTHHDTPTGSQPKIESSLAQELARLGFSYNATTKLYEKKLANGKKLIKDIKTGLTQVI